MSYRLQEGHCIDCDFCAPVSNVKRDKRRICENAECPSHKSKEEFTLNKYRGCTHYFKPKEAEA